jgi:hypothetical protein
LVRPLRRKCTVSTMDDALDADDAPEEEVL